MFSLSIICDEDDWEAGFGGITPPSPIARIILIFRAIAGLGALSIAAPLLNIPRLFNNLDRTWSFDRLLDIFLIESLERVDMTEDVLLAVVDVVTSAIFFPVLQVFRFNNYILYFL